MTDDAVPSSARVAIVDDDDAVRLALTLSLRARGLDVHDFGSASEMLAWLDTEPVDCLVLDVQMPDMDGVSLQQALAERDIAAPVIFVSGRRDLPPGLRDATANLSAVLEKPFSPDTLMAAIASAVAG